MRCLFLLASLLPALLDAQRTVGDRDRAEFAGRRARLLERIGNGVAVVFASPPHHEPVGFRQAPDFWYLTGIDEPGAVLVLNGRAKESRVYARRMPEWKTFVEGPALRDRPDAAAVHGVALHPLERLLDSLPAMLAAADTLWIPLRPQDQLQYGREELMQEEMLERAHPLLGGVASPMRRAAETVRGLAPAKPAADVTLLLDRMRWIKSPYEVERMRAAGRIGAEAVARAIEGTRPGQYEYELEADANWLVEKRGARVAFTPIVASGPNGVVWHYTANDRRMQAGETVYMDYGADVDYYTSDITRTWPVSGRFTAEQERMYRCILEARDAIVAVMKPGVTLAQMQDAAERVYDRHGFRAQFQALGRYVGHPVGVSVHDPGGMSPTTMMAEGVVWNVEPIIEFRERGIHMRLEDTILVTATGAENLTASVPAGVEEVTALVRR
ncbi:MAG TPA: Xaa-Pro peptidase family protein [Gemmatimonadaceae bacterium]|nr:Xaa-Pro peptidase family protein [Gemmatimonadaceae bacterium]